MLHFIVVWPFKTLTVYRGCISLWFLVSALEWERNGRDIALGTANGVIFIYDVEHQVMERASATHDTEVSSLSWCVPSQFLRAHDDYREGRPAFSIFPRNRSQLLSVSSFFRVSRDVTKFSTDCKILLLRWCVRAAVYALERRERGDFKNRNIRHADINCLIRGISHRKSSPRSVMALKSPHARCMHHSLSSHDRTWEEDTKVFLPLKARAESLGDKPIELSHILLPKEYHCLQDCFSDFLNFKPWL